MASAVYLAGAARGAPWDREVADDLCQLFVKSTFG
jgi:hypothetical protein